MKGQCFTYFSILAIKMQIKVSHCHHNVQLFLICRIFKAAIDLYIFYGIYNNEAAVQNNLLKNNS